MAKIRAYKLAEELGIERSQIVDKAASVGVILKSPMASIDDESAAILRTKLVSSKSRDVVTERRVKTHGGAAVIRRRKKAAPPEPVVEPEPVVDPVVELTSEEPVEPAPVAETPAVQAEEVPVIGPPKAPETGDVRSRRPEATQEAARAKGPGGAPGADRDAAKQRKLVREVVNLREQESLARQATSRGSQRRQITYEPRSGTSPRRKRRDAPAVPAKKAPASEVKRIVQIEGSVSVGELARLLGAKAPEVQRRLMALGTMVSINQAIDVDTATQVAGEFGFELADVGFKEEAYLEVPAAAVDESALVTRPPVVTVMGHVDHGKTTLLDALRETNVAAGEAGAITQHVGAYRVELDGKKLTFIDTPGHAAFAAMRARGAQVTDIVVLVVAATEGIMPQTVEAIDHSKAAGVPIVVAINKSDLPGANGQQVRQRLMEHSLVSEEFGGDVICVDVSATQKTGLDKLLEMLTLQAELLELKADPTRRAKGVVLEANLDKGRGAVATVLVQDGTLKRGDSVVAGIVSGRVRTIEDENRKRLKEAGPSTPVQLVGLNGVPEAGAVFSVVESDRIAKEIIDHRLAEARTQQTDVRPVLSLDEFFLQAEGGGIKELPIVIKGDVRGSVGALRDSLVKLSTDAVKVNVLSAGVGGISETDVNFAKASGAIIFGFHVRPDPAARRSADDQGVDIRTYKVIYEVIDDVTAAMVGLLPPKVTEKFLGRVEVREVFTIPKIGTIAGSYVSEGAVRRGSPCRLLRDGVQIYEGKVGSLRRFKDDTREVTNGFECGVGVENYNDIKVGDVIETYLLEEKPATLE